MTIPFLDLFKKLTGRFGGGAAVAEPPAKPAMRVIRPKKADNERLSKTVMPNATRSMSTPSADPFRSAATTPAPRSGMPLELGANKITTSSAPRPRPSQLPPALARALEPKVERTLSLRVADLIDAVPAGFVKPAEILDTNATVLLKASEIEKGMPDKHPTISLPSLYQQVPEIFLRSVRPDDDTRVDLPYEKVLEQFHTAQVRTDQERDPTVPHVDTPILKATIEDSQRFGTKIAPIEMSVQPSVPVKHATAESIAEAEPDATPATVEPAVKTTPAGQRVISLHSPELKAKTETPEPSIDEEEMPFEEVSPNGTGVSASERVPASSGPPVPTPLPFTPQLAKLAFENPREKPVTKEPEKKMWEGPHHPDSDADNENRGAKATPTLQPELAKPLTLRLDQPVTKSVSPVPAPAKVTSLEPLKDVLTPSVVPEKKPQPQISMTIRMDEPMAKSVAPEPKTMGQGPQHPESNPDEHDRGSKTGPTLEPLKSIPAPDVTAASVKPQTATDKSSISFSVKAALQNLPAFQLAGDIAAVADEERFSLPLELIEPQLATGRVSIAPDIFQQALPEKHHGLFQVDGARTAVALPLEEVLKNLPATVLKLRDDQEATEVEKDFETPFFLKAKEDALRFTPKTETEPKAEAKPKVEGTISTEPAPKPAPEKVDPKEIIAQANALAGVKACAITFSDGLSLAGELPENMDADGLSAMAPSMLERITQHVTETKLGELVAMTLYAKNCAVSFFARGNVCLTALHEEALAANSRTRLAELIEKLSKTYAHPEKPNVDH